MHTRRVILFHNKIIYLIDNDNHNVVLWNNKNALFHRDHLQYVTLKGLAMIFAGQENTFIIFRSKEINIYFKTKNKIPINLLK